MRALHFVKPLEYQLETAGEQYMGGTALTGTLALTNRGGTPAKDLRLEVALGFAVFRDLKERGPDALNILATQTLAEGLALDPAQTHKAAWSFDLPLDFPISSKVSGPFFLYGGAVGDPANRGLIDLPVDLLPAMASFISILENHHAFLAREPRHAEGGLEVKFKAPDRYPTVDDLTAHLVMEGDTLHMAFTATGRAIQPGQGGKLGKRENHTERSVAWKEFSPSPASPNRGLYREVWQSVLTEIAPRLAD